MKLFTFYIENNINYINQFHKKCTTTGQKVSIVKGKSILDTIKEAIYDVFLGELYPSDESASKKTKSSAGQPKKPATKSRTTSSRATPKKHSTKKSRKRTQKKSTKKSSAKKVSRKKPKNLPETKSKHPEKETAEKDTKPPKKQLTQMPEPWSKVSKYKRIERNPYKYKK
ncbi:MAG: hypothetical protein ACOCWQ_01590 [Nanoarchaeota archaeon]